MNKTSMILALLFFAASANALQLQKHLIQVELSDAGTAKTTESYVLAFENTDEKIEFIDKAQRNASSILAWKADYEFFYPRFESSDNRVVRSTITFEQTTNTLILEYDLEKALATIVKDEPRETRFGFTGKQLNSFIREGLIVIPNGTEIRLILPLKAQITGQADNPQVTISQNTVSIMPVSTSHISIQYTIQKPIQTKVNSLEIVNDFLTDSSNLLAIIAALIVFAVVFWKKDNIEEKIEGYIVKHSEMEQAEAEEEVDIDV